MTEDKLKEVLGELSAIASSCVNWDFGCYEYDDFRNEVMAYFEERGIKITTDEP